MTKVAIPIVLIHSGNSSYLFDTIFQLSKSNSQAERYIIGTKESRVFAKLITHVYIDDFQEEAEKFDSVYKHFSTNSREFELICLQRWFILRSFMDKNNISKCLYIDSDVLLYSDVNKVTSQINRYGMTICGISGHTNFVSKPVLDEFCQYLLDVYTEENAAEKLAEAYATFLMSHTAGGISDMTFLTRFSELHPDKVGDIADLDDTQSFDITFDSGGNKYLMSNGTKKVIWRNKLPYCIRRSDQMEVLFHTLHFQGGLKKQMRKYVADQSTGYLLWRRYFECIRIYQKIKAKLRRLPN